MDKVFRMKARHIGNFATWLNSVQLLGKESRARSRFTKILTDYLSNDVEKQRVEIVKKYAKLDEEGNPSVIIDSKARRIFDVLPEKSEEMNKEYANLLEHNLELHVTDLNRETISTVKDVVLNSQFVFGPLDNDPEQVRQAKIALADNYTEWCESFEKLDTA